MCVVTKLSF